MNKYQKLIFGLIILLAVFFRFYKLGSVPYGFFSDESAVGYNAYSIIKTGKDEFGKFMPFFFRSFGEGKLPLYIYQAVPSIAVFGLNEFATRFPGAFLSTLTVILMYLLSLELLSNSSKLSKNKEWISLLSMGMLTIMPWHIHFSRGVFGQESLFWIVLGSFLYFKWFKFRKDYKKYPYLILSLSILSFLLSMLTYHAPRVFLPPWLLFLFIYHFKQTSIKQKAFTIILSIILLVIPWFYISLNPLGGARAGGVSIFHKQSGVIIDLNQNLSESLHKPVWFVRLMHNKIESFGRDFFSRYSSHFNPDFLFFSGDTIRPRYRVPNTGQIMWIFMPFFFIGMYYLIKYKQWPMLVWLLIAPIPASVTFETPSTVRALYMVIPIAYIIGVGLWESFAFIKKYSKFIQYFTLVSFSILTAYSVINYYDAYFNHAKLRYPYGEVWQDKYQELVSKINKIQDNYDVINVTDYRSTPYIFFLFYNKYDPSKWQQQVWSDGVIEPAKEFNFIAIRSMDKLHFIHAQCPTEKSQQNINKKYLYVCTNQEIPSNLKEIDRIMYEDNTPAFILYENN